MSSKRALLVGINEYPKFGPAQQLAGCVNDIEVMGALLRASYGFDDVVLLRNGEATRDGILAALADLAGRVGDGDVVVVHYSGHGSQMTDREGDEPDGKDETLVAYDSGRKPHVNRDISDDELYAWIRGVTGKTQNLTLIFDCCHSGTISRDVFGSRSRWVPADERPAAELPPSPVAGGTRGGRDIGPSGWLPLEEYVLMAGCQDDESSYEHDAADGGSALPHGALTFFLTQELARAAPGATYRDVFDSVRARVSAAYPRQHPQLEGATDRELFGIRDLEPMRLLAVASRDGTAVTLAGGAAHGVVAGSEWDVYPAGTKELGADVAALGRVHVTAVRAVDADAELANETAPDAIAPDARAVEAARPLVASRLRVRIAAPGDHASSVDALRARLQGSTLVTTDESGAEPDLQVYVVASRAASAQPVPQLGAVERPSWAVVGRDGRLASPVHAVDEEGAVDRVAENLETLARYRNGLALSNEAAGSALRGRVAARLQQRAQDGSWREVQAGPDGRVVLHEHDQVRVEVENHHDAPVYAAVLAFGVTGQIDLLYPFGGASEPIAPGRSLVVGEREALRLTFPDTFPFVQDPADPESLEGHETLKVFAVTGKPVLFEWLRQEGVRSVPLVERAALDDVAASALGARAGVDAGAPPTSAELEDWTTLELPIVLRRRAPGAEAPATAAPSEPQAVAAPTTGDEAEDRASATGTPEPEPAEGGEEPAPETVEPARDERHDEPWEFDPTFTRNAGLAVALAALLALGPLAVVAGRLALGDAPETHISQLIAIQLLLIGGVIALGAFVLALLEFRGRARVVQRAREASVDRERGLGAELIKATPEIVKNFGQLKPLAALLVIAALLFLCSTALVWHGLGS